jgi:hypothetical protein
MGSTKAEAAPINTNTNTTNSITSIPLVPTDETMNNAIEMMNEMYMYKLYGAFSIKSSHHITSHSQPCVVDIKIVGSFVWAAMF